MHACIYVTAMIKEKNMNMDGGNIEGAEQGRVIQMQGSFMTFSKNINYRAKNN